MRILTRTVQLIRKNLVYAVLLYFCLLIFDYWLVKTQFPTSSNSKLAYLQTPIEDVRIVECGLFSPFCRPVLSFWRWDRSSHNLYRSWLPWKRAYVFVKRPSRYIAGVTPTVENLMIDHQLMKGKKHNLHIQYGPNGDVCDVEGLFGTDASEVRRGWSPVQSQFLYLGRPILLTQRFCSYPLVPAIEDLKKNEPAFVDVPFDDRRETLKILQLSDLHYATDRTKCRDSYPPERPTDCMADATTHAFVTDILKRESPDLVLFTGDLITGDAVDDSKTSLMKALASVVDYDIPFAVTYGNHDSLGDLANDEMAQIVHQVPGNIGLMGNISGVGNFVLRSPKRFSIYVLDSHAGTTNGRACPVYDAIKKDQLAWLRSKKTEFQNDPIQMVFFHIPLKEFCEVEDMVGSYREKCSSSYCDPGTARTLSELQIPVAVAGHDHVNDFCGIHTTYKVRFCMAGSTGFGGYGGHGGYIRRARLWELNPSKRTIRTWKRLEWPPEDRSKIFDEQTFDV
ncbi:phosphoprotein phosphatase [Schizosaccharomyces cryophilus OY26]|uniref:Phosphoprotein phosphatase n=1 Tax=Schizosaccharomyces cryophilus (strain OY26 / ATCC MYA-4695 / CBS 11777 / NBRC 106824 / NRRL Y48691) TaxID=653667 RepID=S9WYT2_SCHCR|nr:phosphoprotein phosphatase [Schizosaccharomyces cryophilus OY26]EPY49837.1 phosphoprotein phosphatase [Schizosaccharomyces cryophilus OY26]